MAILATLQMQLTVISHRLRKGSNGLAKEVRGRPISKAEAAPSRGHFEGGMIRSRSQRSGLLAVTGERALMPATRTCSEALATRLPPANSYPARHYPCGSWRDRRIIRTTRTLCILNPEKRGNRYTHRFRKGSCVKIAQMGCSSLVSLPQRYTSGLSNTGAFCVIRQLLRKS